MRDTLYCVICVVVTLAIALLGLPYVHNSWLFAFFESFRTHLGLACIAGALLALLVRRHWYALLLLAFAVALTAHSVVMLREYAAAPASADAQPNFRLLSFNIDNDNFTNGARIADLILQSKADVVEIFEAMPLLSQMTRLSVVYPYRVGCGVLTDECDSLVMSKRPFLSQTIRSLSEIWRNRFILVTIDMDGQPLALASAHLAKPYFDYFHSRELDVLRDSLSGVSQPLLLAGDFNAAVMEPDMRRFLHDTGLQHVFPEPSTWPIKAGPLGISIDHVFARAPVQLKSVRRIKDAMGSNHYGLITDFTVVR